MDLYVQVNNKYKQFNNYKHFNKDRQSKKNITLHSSIGLDGLWIFPLGLLCDYISKNFFLLIYILVFLIFIGLLLNMIVVLVGERQRLPLKETDTFNNVLALVRNSPNPDDYHLTRKFGNQFIHNHAKKVNVSYDDFPVEKPYCHMSNDDHEKFKSMFESVPGFSGLHLKYELQGRLVCYKNTNNTVHSNLDIFLLVHAQETKAAVAKEKGKGKAK